MSMNIGENILKLRKEKGITQEQLSDVLCVSAGAVSKWETGASMPDIAMLPNIANFFSVSIDRLFDFALTESDSPENIIQHVKEMTDRLEFDYNASVAAGADIKIVMKCDKALSVLTEACVKFPNNYELKAELCFYKYIAASRYIKEPEIYKKELRAILGELQTVVKLSGNKDVNDRCYSIIAQIYLVLEEYDNALETTKKYGCKHGFIVGRDSVVLDALFIQNKTDEAEKYIHNTVYCAINQIYVNLAHYTKYTSHDQKKNEKIHNALLNFLKIFSDGKPGPFDLFMSTNCQVLAYYCYNSGEYEKSVKYFEEMLEHIENFNIFSENRELTSEFINLTEKSTILYSAPFDYKNHLLTVFDLFEKHEPEKFTEIQAREDFQRFFEKLKN